MTVQSIIVANLTMHLTNKVYTNKVYNKVIYIVCIQ